MKQLNKPGDNLGGLNRLWAIRPEDVSSVSNNSISLSSTDNVYDVYLTPGTISFSENEKESGAGNYYDVAIQGFTPKDSPDAQQIINEMKGRRFLIVYQDQNEYFKLVGNTKNALKFTSQLGTGGDTPDLNGHTLLYKGKTLHKAIFIENPFP